MPLSGDFEFWILDFESPYADKLIVGCKNLIRKEFSVYKDSKSAILKFKI